MASDPFRVFTAPIEGIQPHIGKARGTMIGRMAMANKDPAKLKAAAEQALADGVDRAIVEAEYRWARRA